MKKFYWYTFADGYACCVANLNRTELNREAAKHGPLVSKTAA